MAGRRTALQYCRTLALTTDADASLNLSPDKVCMGRCLWSSVSAWLLMESPPVSAADRSRPSPVADARTPPVLLITQWRGVCDLPHPAYSECAAPPPRRSSPNAALLPPPEPTGPSHRFAHRPARLARA